MRTGGDGGILVADTFCYMCGAQAGEDHADFGNRPAVLRSEPTPGERDLKRQICTLCLEGRLDFKPHHPGLIELKTLVRKAARPDQRALLDWLTEKFAAAR